MAVCRAIHNWTFCALVGAFLDLALAYLMLCGAALAFLTAKFLGVFGLRLPCPCGGLFGRPTGHCLQHLLVEYPPRVVSSVQMSVRDRFPFDSVWAEEEGSPGPYDVKILRNEAHSRRLLDMAREEEESCGSVSNSNVMKLQNLSSGGPPSVNDEELPETAYPSWGQRDGSDGKGKGVVSSLRPRFGLRRRRRAAAYQKKSSPIWSSDLKSAWPGREDCNRHMDEQEQEFSGENIKTSNSEDHHSLPENPKRPGSSGTVEGGGSVAGSSHDLTALEPVENSLFAASPEEHANVIRVLEQALKEEKVARSALYMELEKERNAAATAADEAMAMILRLQKEKASIEMEARQYQRMIEEKSAYDEEEMDILKEIIVRREREKHFLEKEVELYRQIMASGEGSEHQHPSDELNNILGAVEQKAGCSVDLADGPKLMVNNFSTYDNSCPENGCPNVGADADNSLFPDRLLHKKEENGAHIYVNPNNLSELRVPVEDLNHGYDEKCQKFDELREEELERSREYDLDFQEKTVDVNHSPQQSLLPGFVDDSSSCKLKGNLFRLNGASGLVDRSGEDCSKSFGSFPSVGIDCVNSKDEGEESCNSSCSQMESEQSIHDVHVIDCKGYEERNEKGSVSSHAGAGSVSSRTSASRFISSRTSASRFEFDGSRKMGIPRSRSTSSGLEETEQSAHRSSSDFSGFLLRLNSSQDSSSFSELRRTSMSAVGKERLKLETEVAHLRERLRIIQQGRERLNFPVENKDKENLQLQLLEEIASQLKEIRQLTEPSKAMRQASLPPSSSQVHSRKRRCRSVPRGST